MEISVSPVEILINQVEAIFRHAIALAPNVAAGLIFLAVTWILARLLRFGLNKSFKRMSIRPALKDAFLTIITVVVWIGGLLIAAMIILPGLTPAQLIAGLGIGSLAIGLAFKDIFENFLAGILIMLRKPMRIGDYIECEDIGGAVEHITIRDTHLRRSDGVLVMVPNGFLYKNPVEVLTDQKKRRQSITVGIAYGEDVAEGRSVIAKSLENLDTIDHARGVQIFAQAFASSSIDFEVTWWCGSRPVEIRRSRDQVVEAVKKALDDAGIEIPFPYRTLTFKEPLESRVVSLGRERPQAD